MHICNRDRVEEQTGVFKTVARELYGGNDWVSLEQLPKGLYIVVYSAVVRYTGM